MHAGQVVFQLSCNPGPLVAFVYIKDVHLLEMTHWSPEPT